MAKSVLEIQEETKNTIKEIAKLQKAANKIAVGKGGGLTQFKFFANKLERFNEVKGNITNVLGFLTNKAAREEALMAEQVGIDLKTFRENQKAARLSEINQALLEKQFEKLNASGINASEFYNKLSDTQKEQIANDKQQQDKLFKLLGETAFDTNRTQEESLKAFEEGLSKLNDTELEQQKQAKFFYMDGVKRQNERDADERRRFDEQKRDKQPLQKNQPQSTISGRTAGEGDDSGIADEVIGSSIGIIIGKYLGKGGAFFKAIGRGLMMIPLGITKLFAFAFNPVGLAVIGGVLLFKFKDEISAFIGKAFNYLGGKINSLFESIGKFVDNILEGIRNYLSKIPIIGRFFKKEGEGTKEVPQVVSEEQIKREQGAMKTLLGGTPSETINQTPQQSMMNTITPNEIISQTGGQSFEQAEGRVQTLQKQLDEKIKRVDEISKNAIDKLITQGQPILTNLVNNAQNTANNITETVVKSVRNNDPLINLTRNYR